MILNGKWKNEASLIIVSAYCLNSFPEEGPQIDLNSLPELRRWTWEFIEAKKAGICKAESTGEDRAAQRAFEVSKVSP